MIKDHCEICRGSRVIRMPRYQRTASYNTHVNDMTEVNYKDFPCPECGDGISENRIAIMKFEGRAYVPYYGQPVPKEYFEHIERDAKYSLLEAIDRSGSISVERGSVDDMSRTFGVSAKIGVVSQNVVASIEQRAAVHQEIVANKVVDEAVRLIRNWGSAYTSNTGPISKDQAIREVRVALRHVLRDMK